jgi:hypothetical protein
MIKTLTLYGPTPFNFICSVCHKAYKAFPEPRLNYPIEIEIPSICDKCVK